ncbi:hypothetical protein BGW80DRAFT_603708 [Lactifluus volemus]|nr:hypothetical protein BGW80DRAFT_603708 [Lactifluus volemus]
MRSARRAKSTPRNLLFERQQLKVEVEHRKTKSKRFQSSSSLAVFPTSDRVLVLRIAPLRQTLAVKGLAEAVVGVLPIHHTNIQAKEKSEAYMCNTMLMTFNRTAHGPTTVTFLSRTQNSDSDVPAPVLSIVAVAATWQNDFARVSTRPVMEGGVKRLTVVAWPWQNDRVNCFRAK